MTHMQRICAKILCLPLILSACGGKQSDMQTIRVWSFTNETKDMIGYYLKDNPGAQIDFSLITTDVFSSKLKSAIQGHTVPDLVALDFDFVRLYVEGEEVLLDLNELSDEADALEMAAYVKQVGTDDQGVLKALAYQACPGSVVYRRSYARRYLGTDDPQAIQEMMKDMESFMALAERLKQNSGGRCFAVSSVGDLFQPYLRARKEAWIVDDTLTIDPKMIEYMDICKIFRERGYEAQQAQWGTGWYASMKNQLKDVYGNPQEVFCYFLPTWGTSYTLPQNSKSADGSVDTSGDWAAVKGPVPYFQGGTWFAVPREAKNPEGAKSLISYFTLNEDFLRRYASDTGDFPASQKIVRDIEDSMSSAFLGGQNSYAVYAEQIAEISTSNLTSYDQDLNSLYNDQLNNYVEGKITQDQAIRTFKRRVYEQFPDIEVDFTEGTR